MATATDVLAVMDFELRTLGAAASANSARGRRITALREARAAVAELIATADMLTDVIAFRIDDPRSALLDVVKSIARCRGEP